MSKNGNDIGSYSSRELKILVVSRSFYPENSPRSIRTTELVKAFAAQGHEVTLLTVEKGTYQQQFEQDFGVTIKALGPLWFNAVDIEASNGLLRIFKRMIRRFSLLFFEYPDIELMFRISYALNDESGYDLLISIAVPYPVHWGVAKARRKNHKIADVWVADCGDPYCGLENDSFRKPFYFSFIEKWFSRKADYLTIPFEGARTAYFKEFYPKIRVIPQGVSFPEQGASKEAYVNDSITFAYFGNIRSYLHYAIPFLKRLNAIDEDFRFIIYTKDHRLFEDILTKRTLQKCDIRGYAERDLLLNQLSDVDFLIHFPYQKDSQKSLKLIDYFFLGKPILSYTNDEQSNQHLDEFLQYNFDHKMACEDYTKYDITTVANQFLKLAKSERPAIMTFVEGE